MTEFYVIIDLRNITIDNIDTSIINCKSKQHALSFPNISFIIEKNSLGSKCENELPRLHSKEGSLTGFIFPFVYTYDILDNQGNPSEISYGNAICRDFQILTRRSGYSVDKGRGDVNIEDRFGNHRFIELEARRDVGISVIKNLIIFLLDFENTCFSSWRVYDKIQDLNSYESNFKKIEDVLYKRVTRIKTPQHHHKSYVIYFQIDSLINNLEEEIEARKLKILKLEEDLQYAQKKVKQLKSSSIYAKKVKYRLRKLKLY